MNWYLREIDSQGGAVPIEKGARLVAGRGSTVDFTLRDPGVSRRHFEVENRGNGLVVRDLGSKGGTFVNGRQVTEATLGAGDTIEAGSSHLVALQVQPLVPRLERGAVEVVRYSSGQPGLRVPLDGSVLVGRNPESDIAITDQRVSRRHLEIRPTSTGAVAVDLAPQNRTEVNGRRLQGSRQIGPGDRIQIADLDEVLVIETAEAHQGPMAVEVTDMESGVFAVEIDAAVDATVADVTRKVGEFLGVNMAADKTWTLVHPDAGVVLHPENRWGDAGVRRGDRYILVGLSERPPALQEAVRYGPARVALNQLPRKAVPPKPHRVRTPIAPESQSLRGRGVVWQIVGGLGIIVAGVAMVLINPAYAPFAIIGGLVGTISVASGILGEQSRRKHGVRRFKERIDALQDELSQVVGEQADTFNEVNPGPEDVVRWVTERSRRLWERRPSDADFLRLRFASGRRRSLLETDHDSYDNDNALATEARKVVDSHRYLEHVPILTPPPVDAPVVGLVGSRRDVMEVASWLLLQAAALHSPAELDIAVPAVNQDWMWARWLPHLESSDGIDLTWNESDAVLLARKLSVSVESEPRLSREKRPERLVLVPHGATEVMGEVMGRDGGGSTLYVVLADRASELPSRVDAVITVNGDEATYEGPGSEDVSGTLAVDRLSHEVASDVARLLGRYVDARKPPQNASGQLGLLDLYGIGRPDEIDLVSLWSNPAHPRLSAVVGTAMDDEPLVLGFRSDGVHGVVGGTTGSGKSEFLQTLLVSLAITHRPDQLNFFLIDFKGGASFAALSELPHVAGVVTDLEKDATLANRAFTSLEAEMARRKNLLDQARVPGLIEYERLPESASNPIPALLVVIDEFALLVRQQPEVKERLDLVATQGRSLGVHLLLATQSPSNVITPSIRSNTQVWISLRVVDDSESSELLGHRDAARIPSDRPGRGFVRFGGSQNITGFQTARIARPAGEAANVSSVSIRPFADVAPSDGRTTAVSVPAPGRVVTELELVCSEIATRSKAMGVTDASPLWLDPLPGLLPAPTVSDGLIHEPGELGVLIGLRDDPARHVQEPYTVDLARAGNLLVLGSRGTGKSTTLRQVLVDLAEQHSPAELHLYGVESGTGSLTALADLPHSGAMVPAGDRERLYRLFDRLTSLMARRREELAASGFADFKSWRRSSAVPEPWVVLAIDDYPAFKEAADGSGLGLLNDQLLSLCQGGASVGIHVVLATSQSSDIRLNLVNLFGGRVLHRQVDAADYSLLDLRLRPNELPPATPGRALVAGGHEVQVYHSGEERLSALGERWRDADGGPERIGRLPTEVQLDSVAQTGGEVAIGLGGPEYRPIGPDMDRGEPHLVIAGESRTGRSTTLLTIHQAFAFAFPDTRFIAFAPRPSPLRDQSGVDVASTADQMLERIEKLATSEGGHTILLIDDAESLPPGVGDRLEPLLRDATQLRLKTFVAGRSTDLSRSFESWARYLLSLRSGLLLMPPPDGGHVLDVRLPAVHTAMTPGRGFVCQRGEITFIQVALPDDSSGKEVVIVG